MARFYARKKGKTIKAIITGNTSCPKLLLFCNIDISSVSEIWFNLDRKKSRLLFRRLPVVLAMFRDMYCIKFNTSRTLD